MNRSFELLATLVHTSMFSYCDEALVSRTRETTTYLTNLHNGLHELSFCETAPEYAGPDVHHRQFIQIFLVRALRFVVYIHVVLTAGTLAKPLNPPLAPLALATSSPVRGHILDETVDLASG